MPNVNLSAGVIVRMQRRTVYATVRVTMSGAVEFIPRPRKRDNDWPNANVRAGRARQKGEDGGA